MKLRANGQVNDDIDLDDMDYDEGKAQIRKKGNKELTNNREGENSDYDQGKCLQIF